MAVKVERLVAAKQWVEEVEARLAQAAAAKWQALGEEFEGDDPPEGYEARAGALDVTAPIFEALARARALLDARALEVVADRSAWPAGGSSVARACALADALASAADAELVAAELLVLRGGLS